MRIHIIFVCCLLFACDAKNRQPVSKTDPVRRATGSPVETVSAEDCPADPVFGGVQMATAKITFPDAPGSPSIVAELAATDTERARGLMYRTHMAKNTGMLFLPDGPPKVQTFWMKNTCISLDMMFITTEGVIAGILENVPPMNLEYRSVQSPSSYVLEVNAGWSNAVGVEAGQHVILPTIGAAQIAQ